MHVPTAPGNSEPDEPLPQTLRFVLVMGALFTAGWFAMFFLLQNRW